MKGLKLLNQLPIDVKQKIIDDYGSLKAFYQLVYELNKQHFKYSTEKIDDSDKKIEDIKNSIFDIEEKLEFYGVDDGSEITVEISNDHAATVVKKEISKISNIYK